MDDGEDDDVVAGPDLVEDAVGVGGKLPRFCLNSTTFAANPVLSAVLGLASMIASAHFSNAPSSAAELCVVISPLVCPSNAFR